MSGFLSPISPLPTDEDDGLDNALQALVVGITAIPGTLVRPRWQRVPPSEPSLDTNWCAIGGQDATPDDGPYLAHVDSVNADPKLTGQTNMQRHEMVDVVASFYGPSARTLAGALRDGLTIEPNRYALLAVGIGIREIGAVRRLPDLVGEEFRNRVDFTFTITRQIDRIYPIRNILSSTFTPLVG